MNDDDIKKGLANLADEVLANLTDRERKALQKRFGISLDEKIDLNEAMKQFEETRRRIREIEQKALAKLRNKQARNLGEPNRGANSMSTSPSLAIKYFGTEVPPVQTQILKAGPLSAELDAGNLRYIRYGGVEVMRAISYVVRDTIWGTYNPDVQNLSVQQDDDQFKVTYHAVCKDDKQEIHYDASITGKADGSLLFEATNDAKTDFHSRRVGFVVLHALDGVAGCPVEVLHVDGNTETSVFPKLVEPWQPFFDIRALTTEPVPGLKVTCTMEGDTFEMEDHRNWTDASYKTYVRPLAAPAPFTISAGERIPQSVSLSISGPVPTAAGTTAGPVTITLGDESGTMPKIGMGVHPRRAEAALDAADLIKQAGPQVLICHFDPRDGHNADDLRRFKALGDASGADLVLELVVPCDDDYRQELAGIAEQIKQAGVNFSAVTVAPGADLIAGVPFSDFPKVPPLGDLYREARKVFPGVAIGGGSFSYFTECNRRRPDAQDIDYLSHVTCAIVHAADDRSITETLEAVPYVITTARSFAGGKPYWVGPSAIASRHSPFGGAPAANPNNDRITMVRMDPRQRSLLGAAYYLGYIARMAEGGLDQVAIASPVGEFGVIYRKMDWDQPGFDGASAQVYPVYHIIAGMAAAALQVRVSTTSDNERDVQAVAYRKDSSVELWLANLSGEPRQISIAGLPGNKASMCTLDADSFESCVYNAAGFNSTRRELNGTDLTLAPYAVVRIETV